MINADNNAMTSQRTATRSDAPAILTILVEVAHKIPVLIDTDERRQGIFEQIEACCDSGHSLVATDGTQIVGFLLARADLPLLVYDENRHLGGFTPVLEIGVLPEHAAGDGEVAHRSSGLLRRCAPRNDD